MEQPRVQPFPPAVGESRPGTIANTGLSRLTSLVESRAVGQRREARGAQYMYDLLLGLVDESRGHLPDDLRDSIRQVRFGFGCLAYDHFSEGGQVAFALSLRDWRENVNLDHVELTPEQAGILQKVAGSVGIPYDTQQTRFDFLPIERRIRANVTEESRRYMDMDWS